MLKVTWDDGISSGGVPYIDWKVDYEDVPGVWIELASGLTSREFISDFVPVEGKTYNIAVKARNSVGYSAYSENLPVLAAQKPDMPTNV